MKVFLSSTFRDLQPEREAVLRELHKRNLATRAMEYFVATPTTPQETALDNLRDSDLMILLIGFKAGSLLPDGSGGTYTSAEYDELLKAGKEPLVFLREGKRHFWNRKLTWFNAETKKGEKEALDAFKNKVGAAWTWDRFSTPDQLALGVIQALDRWEANGRPGARKTFASPSEYFSQKESGQFQILDFETTLLGRENEIEALNDFAKDPTQRVCVLSGRGGIGKSKLLHDWINGCAGKVIFLKDQPLWHPDSEKEIPVDANILVVDDAHRQESFSHLLQIFKDLPKSRDIKVVVSTRPGGSSRLVQDIFRMKIDSSNLTQLPELQELTKEQSRALAEQILGSNFRGYADHLAEVAGRSPLVIVAGGRLIASRKIDPSALTNLDDFRATIFNRFLDEMDLSGPRFPIDPPRPLLELIAALGPVDVSKHEFQSLAATYLNCPTDEVLGTLDALAKHGIITQRDKPVRILPDVLSDFILEDRCIGPGSSSTKYADRVYAHFGAHALKELMRNLSELDWRRGMSTPSGLNLLGGIWADIYQRFRNGDEYERHTILSDLAPAAIYQPEHILALTRIAIDNPIVVSPSSDGSRYRSGQDYVLSSLPSLLEATAHHAEYLPESVTILWELSEKSTNMRGSAETAQSVIKRLASWRRYGHAAMNFAMLLQAVRFAKQPDAFAGVFTPLDIIDEILEREGEFTEMQDEASLSIGSFGLNYSAVGPVRESALDYLEFVLDGDGRPAFLAIGLLDKLMHNYLTRMGRTTSQEEVDWQNRERDRSLDMLLARFGKPMSNLLEARLYDAIRSATAIQCPPHIRQRASSKLDAISLSDGGLVLDGICTADYELPMLDTDIERGISEREAVISALMAKARDGLERIGADMAARACFLIEAELSCIDARIETKGFQRFIQGYSNDPEFLIEVTNQIQDHAHLEKLVGILSYTLSALRTANSAEFRRRAAAALSTNDRTTITAFSYNLRVFSNAVPEDVEILQQYGNCPDVTAKSQALFAIAYMGKFVELRDQLKEVALSIDPDGDHSIADKLAEAFGPYGVQLTMLKRTEAKLLASRFLPIKDWDSHHGSIPRFLNRFNQLFPDETFYLLAQRISVSIETRKKNQSRFSTFDLTEEKVSFASFPPEKQLEYGRQTLDILVTATEGFDQYSALFWMAVGTNNEGCKLILDACDRPNGLSLPKVAALIDKSSPNLAFSNPTFCKLLIKCFSGADRQIIIDDLARNASSLAGGGVYSGNYEDFVAAKNKQFHNQMSGFPDEPELADLYVALRRYL
jgi:hypothetical protein